MHVLKGEIFSHVERLCNELRRLDLDVVLVDDGERARFRDPHKAGARQLRLSQLGISRAMSDR